MSIKEVCKLLDSHRINYDLVINKIRFYYKDGDYGTIEVTEFGDVSINGRIADFKEWLNRW